MSLRSTSALWFELLVERDDLTRALEVLARSGLVELQTHSDLPARNFLSEVQNWLAEYDELARLYAHYWPEALVDTKQEGREPEAMLQMAMQRVRQWVEQADDLVATLQAMEKEQQDLLLLASLFANQQVNLPDPKLLRGAGPFVAAALFLIPDNEWPDVLPSSVITQSLTADKRLFLLAVGEPADMEQLKRQLTTRKARHIDLPDWLPDNAVQAQNAIRSRQNAITEQSRALREQLTLLNEQQQLADALANVQLVRWFIEQVPELPGTDNFSWITGWTASESGEDLLGLLAENKIRGLLRTSEPPAGIEPPSLLRNPAWMRPFEFFTGLMGVPGAGEADPTPVVAITAPLMFGYMFGDIGHGAVLMAVGAFYWRRFPALKLLVAGGAASVVFGILYGSLFAREDIIPALWLHPLEHPVLILIVPLIGGAVLLLTGLIIDAVQHAWQHNFARWLTVGAALLICYLALLGSFFDIRLLWLALTAAVWYVTGSLLAGPSLSMAALGSAVTELAETLLQLAVNTISFVRVGAFALAHAGLSAAVVGVAEAPSSATAALIVLILGNLLIIGLEGLIVGIQTTRLLLFEFFVRFLRAQGRPFKPLQTPDSSSQFPKR